MRWPVAVAVVVCICPSLLSAADTTIGSRFPQLALTDLDGKATTLSAYQGANATVAVFLSFECPVANSYAEPLEAMAKSYAERGVKFVAICPSAEPPDALRKAAAEFKFTIPVCRDPKTDAARALGATVTPEACVFDSTMTLRYRGRIDDAYVARLKKNPKAATNDLRDALEAVLAGKAIATPVVAAVGCPIELAVGSGDSTAARAAVAPAAGAITYHKDVAPILTRHCANCHRPNEVAPFSLQTYAQAKKWASDIKTYTQSRQMPPWLPHDGPGFKNERRLSDGEIKTLAAWVDAGTPAGEPKTETAAVPESSGWRNGPPDLVLTLDEDFHLGATGADLFRVFVMPTGLTEHKWVIGYDVKPGNRRVVHHTLNFFDGSGQARELEEKARAQADPLAADRGPGYTVGMGGVGFLPPAYRAGEIPKYGGIGGWAPGQQPQFLIDGAGWFLPAGSDFLVQVHYHRDGKPATDRVQVGLYFAKTPIKQPWQSVVINGMKPWDKIPANAARHECKGTTYLHAAADLHSVMPHMHLLGQSIKVTMTPPGGPPQVLVDIASWDYNWQETYWFAKPIRAPVGTKIEVAAVFDNSSSNSNNPHAPPKDVYQGEQTTNEMLFAFIGTTSTVSPWERVVFRSSPPSK